MNPTLLIKTALRKMFPSLYEKVKLSTFARSLRPEEGEDYLRVHIGCGERRYRRYINVD